jgi:hypothetical protein
MRGTYESRESVPSDPVLLLKVVESLLVRAASAFNVELDRTEGAARFAPKGVRLWIDESNRLCCGTVYAGDDEEQPPDESVLEAASELKELSKRIVPAFQSAST